MIAKMIMLQFVVRNAPASSQTAFMLIVTIAVLKEWFP